MTSSAGCCLLLQRDHKEVCPVRGFCGTFATKSVMGFVSLEKKGLLPAGKGRFRKLLYVLAM